MALTEITASKEIEGIKKSASIAFDFGENLSVAVKKFGEEIVFTNFKAAAKITAQSAMRRYLETNSSAEEIATKMSSWKPGVALERVVDPVAALVGRWDSYSGQEQAEILKKLKEKK